MAFLGQNNSEGRFERFEKQDAGAETMVSRYRIVVNGVYNARNSLSVVNSSQRKAALEYKTQIARAEAAANIDEIQNLTVQTPDMPSEVIPQDQPVTQQQLDVSAAQQRVNDSHERPLAA